MYAFIRDQWLECIADNYAQVHGRSEREWHLILDERRAHQRQHGKKRITINSTLLADFLEEMATEEPVLLQHQCDLEERSVRERLSGHKPLPVPEPEWEEDDELDLTTIPRYEEYR